jgi:hypothetical protein
MHELCSTPLFADGLIQIIIFIVVVLVSIASQFGNQQKQRRAPQRRVAPPKPAPAAPAAPPPIQQANRSNLESEIEQFVRRTMQPNQQPAAQQPPRVQPPRRDNLPPKKMAKVGTQKPPAQPRTASKKRTVVAEVASVRRPGGLAERDAHLADVIENRDEEMESHLKNVFGHKVGTLSKGAAAYEPGDQSISTAAPSAMTTSQFSASDMLQLFRSPSDIRNAIVMSEILNRPKDPWDS